MEHLNDDGIIVLHDCNPLREDFTVVPMPDPVPWVYPFEDDHSIGPFQIYNGDVYKTILWLKSSRPDVLVNTISDIGGGIGVVFKKPSNLIQVSSLDKLDWDVFDSNRKEYLGLIDYNEFKERYMRYEK